MDQIVKTPARFDIPAALQAPRIPDYMLETYHWAYINPSVVAWLDRELVVSTILWGNSRRLARTALAEIEPGTRVLQPAYVYGDFTPALARHVGERGSLDILDIVPLQVDHCRKKLAGQPWAQARLADAADPGGGPYDAVCCYFLLHEIPHDKKRAVVDALLARLAPGGKAVFVDYHRPSRLHPLRGLMHLVWRRLEPYAVELTETEIADLAEGRDGFTWSKETFFGGLYQKVVAVRRCAGDNIFGNGKVIT